MRIVCRQRIGLIAIGVWIAVCFSVLTDKLASYYAPHTVPLADFSQPALWGRKAFIPDWVAGEQADLNASEHFLKHWAPDLPEFPLHNMIPAKQEWAEDLFVVTVPHWLEVRPFQDPSGLSENPSLNRKFAALGESEPFAFAIRSLKHPARVTLTLENWQFNGAEAAALNHSVRLMAPYRVREKAGKRDTRQVVKPMVLLANKSNTWTFPRAYTMVLVVDVHVDKDAAPGIYSSTVTIRSHDLVIEQIPILLEVLPFELRVNQFHVGAFGTTYDIWEGGFTGYYPPMIEMDSRYGFNMAGGFFNKGNEIPFKRDPHGKLIVDRARDKFKKFDRTMALLRGHGMGDVLFWNWGGSGKYRQFLKVLSAAGIEADFNTPAGKYEFAHLLRAIKDVETSRAWPEIVVNPFDEALKDQQATREIIAAMPYVKAVSPKSRLYMTEWRSGYTRHYQSAGKQLTGNGRPRETEYRALLRSGEQPVANFDVIGSNVLDHKGRALQTMLGGEYWNYTGAWSISPTTQFALGFRAWITQSETVLIWANYKGSLLNRGWTVHHPLPIDPNGRKNRDTRGPVLAGAQSYAVREGIDDRKYLETLRYHAWRTGSEENWRFLSRVSKISESLVKNPRTMGGVHNVAGQLLNATGLSELRAEVKNRILTLLNKPSVAP